MMVFMIQFVTPDMLLHIVNYIINSYTIAVCQARVVDG